MLDLLDAIDWQRFECPCGDARHLPVAVRGLLSPDLSVVTASYWGLENHVVAQGTVHDAARHLLPILLAVFATATHPLPTLDLLFQIGAGSASDPLLTVTCRRQVILGLQGWLASSGSAWPALRQSVAEDLLELQERENGATP